MFLIMFGYCDILICTDVAPKVFTAISKSLDDGVATINWDVRNLIIIILF